MQQRNDWAGYPKGVRSSAIPFFCMGVSVRNTIIMKNLSKTVLMAAAAVLTILVSCRPETTAGQEEPPAPGPPPAEKSIAPSISIALDSIILYPYGTRLPSCVEFSIKELSEGGEVSVKKQEDLDLSLTYERTTGCGALTILATEAFFEKSKAILVARNGELSDEKEITVEIAYINASPHIKTTHRQPKFTGKLMRGL